MNIKTIKVGYLETNCYILENNNETLIIDPGDEYLKIEQEITKPLVGIIVTHNHFDHVGAVSYFRDKYNVLVYNNQNLTEGVNKISNFNFEVIYTPGHTDDSITIYFKEDNCMFVGDFVFKRTIGRTDLPGGDFAKMNTSIDLLKAYSDATLYPGHGESTSLEDEKKNNIYFR